MFNRNNRYSLLRPYITLLCTLAVWLVFVRHAHAINQHPRIWLTPSLIASMQGKAAASDPDWLSIKAAADGYSKQLAPSVTIATCSNGSPVRCTSTASLPFSGTASCYFGGATSGWAPLNSSGSAGKSCTLVDATHFDVNTDSSAFGAYAAQNVTVWIRDSLKPGFFAYDYEGIEWWTALQDLGLAYKITGSTTYSTAARTLLSFINTLGAAGIVAPIAIDSGFPARSSALGLALGYDWCYDQLTAAEKSATAVTVNLWHDWAVASGYSNKDRADSNYWSGYILGNGLTGYATAGDNSRGQEIIDYWRNQWNTAIAKATTIPPPGTAQSPAGNLYSGYPIESYSYGGNTLIRYLQYMLAIKTATGEDLLTTSGLPDSFMRALIHNTTPDRIQTTREGDWAGSETVLNMGLPLVLSYTQSGTLAGAWAQWYYQHRGTPPSGAVNQLASTEAQRLMFYDSSRPATDPGLTLSTNVYLPGGSNRFVYRSDWSTTAVYSSFVTNTDNSGSHQTRVAGNIDIARAGDRLIIPAGQWKGTAGTNGAPEQFIGTNDHWNTLFFSDGTGGYCFDGASYSGCQGVWGMINSPIRYKVDEPGYQYSLAELTQAYSIGQYQPWSNRTLRYWFRDFVALGGGAFLVFDRSKATNSSFIQEVRFHLSPQGTPTQTSGVVSNIVGNSAVFIKPVLPASNSLTLTRGPLNGTGAPFTWRASIANAAPNTDLTALTLVYATSKTAALPGTQLLTTAPNWIGVQIADSTPRVAVLASGVSASGDNYVANTYTSTTFTSTHAGTGNYLVAGLTAGTYSVSENGSVLSGYASVSVDNSGVLYFTAPAGSFAITSTGAAASTAVSAISCNPTTLTSGGASTCTLTLTGNAPAGGSVASLSTNVAGLQTPSSVTVLAGNSSASFSVSGTTVTSSQNVVLTASLNGTATATLVVNPSSSSTPGLSGLSCSPSTVVSGNSFNCTVNLAAAAPLGGLGITLTGTSSAITLPGLTTVLAAALTSTFNVTTTVVTASQNVTITARYGTATATATITLQPPAASSGAHSYTCSSNTFVMDNDITLTGADTVDLVGTATNRCTVKGNGHRFIVPDWSWTGHFRLQFADVQDAGTASLDIFGGAAAGSWGIISGSGYLDIQDTSFSRSSGFTILTSGTSYVIFRRVTYGADNLVPIDYTSLTHRPWLKEWGTSTAPKYFQSNRTYRSWIEVGSPNWTVGAARGCTSCDADGNIMIGKRVGISAKGAGSYVSYNYTHINLDITPDTPFWSQVYNVQNIAAGVVVEHNIFRTGHWLASGIDGEFRNNVLLELSPHNFVRIGKGGMIHHNIMLTLYPGQSSPTIRLKSGDAAFGLVQTGNELSIYNNTLDARGSAVRSILWAMNGSTLTSYRNNVAYRLALTAIACPTSVGCTSAVGASDTEGYVTPPPPRALYLDYNNVFYDASSQRRVTYDLGVAGKSLCQPSWGGNDIGGCADKSVDPQFRGPLPMGSGQTGFGSVDDSGFPFNDSDILSGAYPVSSLLAYFRWVYAPRSGSPLVGAQDPQDGPGDVGAVQSALLPASAPAVVITNKRPMVYAGPSFSVTDSSATVILSGYGADDALPSAVLTFQWSQVSGPGSVTFGNAAQANTTAKFSALGTYTLRLTASDGTLTSTSDAAITVGTAVPVRTCDLNGDGVVDSLDIAIVRDLALQGRYDSAADVSGDGKVNIIDSQRIINATLGGGCRLN